MNSNNENTHLDLCIRESDHKQNDIPEDVSECRKTNSIDLPAFEVDSLLHNHSLSFRDDVIETPEDDHSPFADQSSIFDQPDHFSLKESMYFNNDVNENEIELREKLRLITNANMTDI